MKPFVAGLGGGGGGLQPLQFTSNGLKPRVGGEIQFSAPRPSVMTLAAGFKTASAIKAETPPAIERIPTQPLVLAQAPNVAKPAPKKRTPPPKSRSKSALGNNSGSLLLQQAKLGFSKVTGEGSTPLASSQAIQETDPIEQDEGNGGGDDVIIVEAPVSKKRKAEEEPKVDSRSSDRLGQAPKNWQATGAGTGASSFAKRSKIYENIDDDDDFQ